MPRFAPDVAHGAHERLAGPKQWVEVEGGDFGALHFPGGVFEQASSAQARFLAEHLLARRRIGGSQ